MSRVCALFVVAAVVACGSEPPANGSESAGGTGGGAAGGGAMRGGAGGESGDDSGGEAGNGGQGAAASGCRAPAREADQPTLLSETGCVDMADPSRPAPGLIPYDVSSALWSDGAVKHRFAMIPEGAQIHVKSCAAEPDTCEPPEMGGSGADEGHWGMPVGTVLVKHFSIDGQLVETRLLIQTALNSWDGFSYEWNDEGSEATLLDDELDKDLGEQTWHFPSRSQCLECHTRGAGRSLGPTTAQMNRDFDYEDGTMNQVEYFESLGLFDAPPEPIDPYPDPYGSAPLEDRARSYLHTNCAICHRPGGTLSDIDFRFTTPFEEMDLLCAPIIRGTGDPALPQIRLVPGSPEESSLSFRMHDTTNYRMPRIGSNVVDPDGVELIDDWISAMPGTCPP